MHQMSGGSTYIVSQNKAVEVALELMNLEDEVQICVTSKCFFFPFSIAYTHTYTHTYICLIAPPLHFIFIPINCIRSRLQEW